MATKRKGLGRGLDALLADNKTDDSKSGGVLMLRTADIEPNPKQARRVFDREALDELAESIRLHGLLQPIAVRPKENGFYEIIAGERRWRACKIAGLTEVPVRVKDVTGQNAAELSLIENLQREDLNPVEEANGYKALTEGYGLTQEQAAERVGKSRVAVTNAMRILKLPDEVLQMVENGELSGGHARALLPLCTALDEKRLAEKAAYVRDSGLSVRETEKYVKLLLSEKPAAKSAPVLDSYYKSLEHKVSSSMGRHVAINRNARGGGKVLLSYSGTEDLETLLKALCGNSIFD